MLLDGVRQARHYYHVLPESYRPGEDILTFDDLERMGRPPVFKWRTLNSDSETNMVVLFRHHSDAFAYREDHGGTVYVIDLPEEFVGEYVGRNAEKSPAVVDRIPAKYITGPSDRNGVPCRNIGESA